MLSRAHWEHGLTLQDTKTSHFGHTLCMLCEKFCYHKYRARWVHSCSRKINPKIPHNVLEWGRRRQQSSISTICPHGKNQNPSPVQGEHSQEPLTAAGQTWSHNRVKLLICWHNSSRDTKLHRTDRCWTLQTKLRHMNLMGSFPAFSYSLQYCYSDAQHQRI